MPQSAGANDISTPEDTDSPAVTPQCILVAGMHRSGTSALTRVLSLLGARLPEDLMPGHPDVNPTGFWESFDVVAFNDAVLAERDSAWLDALPLSAPVGFDEAEISAATAVLIWHGCGNGLSVIKDPRICRVLPLWIEAVRRIPAEPVVVIPFRHPVEVARSLLRRDGLPITYGLYLWLYHVLDAERFSRGVRHSFSNYEDLLADWRSEVGRIGDDLGITWPVSPEEAGADIDGFVNPDYRNQTDRDAGDAHPDLLRLCLRLWQSLREDRRLPAALVAETKDALATGEDLFTPMVRYLIGRLNAASPEGDAAKTLPEIDSVVTERQQALDRLAALEAEVKGLHEELQETRRRLGETETSLATMTERAETAAADLALARVHLHAFNIAMSASSSTLFAQRRRLAQYVLDKLPAPRRFRPPRWRRMVEDSGLFDPVWYVSRYPDVEVAGMAPIDHFLLKGAKAGYDPHPLFSVRHYLIQAPDVATSGINPLVHFLKSGGREGRSPHPLFDPHLYDLQYPEVLANGGNPLLHYLADGGKAGARPHWLFDGAAYLAAHPECLRENLTPLEHFLWAGPSPDLQPHWAFDSGYYLVEHPEIATTGITPLEHFLWQGAAEGYNPSPRFDVARYREKTPGIAPGENPLVHFVRGCDGFFWLSRQGGGAERSPLSTYLSSQFGDEARDRLIALMAGHDLPFSTSRVKLPEPTGEALDAIRAAIEELDAARPRSDVPDVSIIIPVYNQLAYTLACVQSVLTWPSRYTYEIIIGDDCSTDGTGPLFAEGLASVRHVRGEVNGGFIKNCNAAAAQAIGRYVVFLNNDTVVLPGWLDELIGTLERDPTIGMAGSKLLYPDATLQECGGIIWQDGSAWNYGRGQDPHNPKFSYMRDVDYVSGASIALSRALWEKVGGFDTHYDVAYGEDSDLALRLRYWEGLRVVVQPLSQLVHFEGISSGTDVTSGVKAYQVSNGEKLIARWHDALQGHRPNGLEPEMEKERPVGARALVIDHCTPTPDQDAGSLTCLRLMEALQANGYKVTFIPETNFCWMPQESRDLQRIGIEALYGPYVTSVSQSLAQAGGSYDVVLVFRNGAALRTFDTIRALAPEARLIFHSSDLHFIREERELAVLGAKAPGTTVASVAATKATELKIIDTADVSIVHSTYEQEILAKETPGAKVYVFPWILDSFGRRQPFSGRSGLIFLGGYGHPPNVDAVLFFVREVWPLVRQDLPEATFYAAGANAPQEIRELHGKDGVVVTGFIEDLGEYFDKVVLSVAPIRYGAGIKGKVAMSQAYGVPCVATSCAAEGMGLVHGENVLIADTPSEMARQIVAAYRDEALWTALSDGSLKFVDDTYSSALGTRRMCEIIDIAGGDCVRATELANQVAQK